MNLSGFRFRQDTPMVTDHRGRLIPKALAQRVPTNRNPETGEVIYEWALQTSEPGPKPPLPTPNPELQEA